MPALIVHKDAEILRELCFAENIPLSDDNSKWKINFISEKELALEVSEIEDEKEVESEKNIFEDEKVRERLLWKYPFANERAIPSCISISEIKKKYMEFMGEENEEQLYKSECTEKIIRKSGLTAAQKGTVMHSVMEHIDFKAEHSKESIDKLINEMVSEGLLTKEEGDFVNREKILKFFESDLGKRVAASAKVYKEESFAMEILPSEIYLDEAYDTAESGTIIHGIIDCFFEEDGDLVLFDYKTDYVPEGKEEEVDKKYKIQLSMYKKAIEAATGKRVKEAYIYFFFKDKELKLL